MEIRGAARSTRHSPSLADTVCCPSFPQDRPNGRGRYGTDSCPCDLFACRSWLWSSAATRPHSPRGSSNATPPVECLLTVVRKRGRWPPSSDRRVSAPLAKLARGWSSARPIAAVLGTGFEPREDVPATLCASPLLRIGLLPPRFRTSFENSLSARDRIRTEARHSCSSLRPCAGCDLQGSNPLTEFSAHGVVRGECAGPDSNRSKTFLLEPTALRGL